MIRFALKQHLILVCACIVMLILAGCGSSVQASNPTATIAPIATTMPTATVAVAVTATIAPVATTSGDGVTGSATPCSGTYSNPHLSLSCPAGWTTTSFSSSSVIDGVALLSGDGADNFTITPLNQALGADQYVTFLQGFLTTFGVTAITINPTANQQVINGNNYTINQATFDRSSTPYTAAQLVTVHNGFTYFLETLAPTTDYSAVGNQYFQTILTSLQLK